MDKEIKLYKGKVNIQFKDSNHSYWIETDEKKKDGTLKLKRLVGVTTLIGILDKPALIPWAVRTTINYIKDNLDKLQEDPETILQQAREESNNQKNIAAEIGSAIHGWVEQHIKKEKPEMPEDPKVLQGVVNFLEWVEKNKVKFVATEQIAYSKKHEYVGTLDILAKVDGKLCLIDIKTGNAIYSEVRLQTAAYRAAYEEETETELDGRWVWRISKETKEEYEERQKARQKADFKPYEAFEAVYLDNDTQSQKIDLKAFLACQHLYQWKKTAII